MSSSINYTDTGKVATALAVQSPEILSSVANVGDTQITVSTLLNKGAIPQYGDLPPLMPNDWQVGSRLILDATNDGLYEVVTITGLIQGNTVPISALQYTHSVGATVMNGTQIERYIGAASRWFDTQTHNKFGFGYEPITETKEAYINNNGNVVVPLSKPIVKLADVQSISFQGGLIYGFDTLSLQYARIRDSYFLEVVPQRNYVVKSGMATITYSGGYNPIPDDIVLATTVMAARFYKERDSGYSDAIGNSDLGLITYKKSCPADIKMTISNYKRWTE